MTSSDKKWIDDASFEDLLYKNRYAPIGDRFFRCKSELNDYFNKSLQQKRSELSNAEQVAASKSVG